ncbi:zinc ribbon domain-containing protein [Acetanaerobacterium elongatum]|uniref:Zinc-ribbon domain-containing protein n=1 Tax=Acetanaerobacterium elongatum TaxID=258515 RepID=A0A1G9U2Y3_9FIRM|nr:zinc-ribbon domain-containing protein [Acetanaerobacterium elongatum]SDM54261.1 zinc-ribbon domain-containing protein [Acetanaerobacterium elongatum]
MFCPKCGTANPDDAQFCQKCGQSFAKGAVVVPDQPTPIKTRWYKKSWLTILLLILFYPVGLILMWLFQKKWNIVVKIIISCICGLLLISTFLGSLQHNDNPTVASSKAPAEVSSVANESSSSAAQASSKVSSAASEQSSKASSSAPKSSSVASSKPESSKAVAPVRYEAKLSNGHYTAGIDFPAGVYNIKAVSGGGNVSSSNMYDGGLNAVMGVAEKGDMYQQEYSNIELPENTVLSISGVVINIVSENPSTAPLKKREQPNTKEISLGNGNFTAGKDFPAGVYDVIAVSGAGNVSSDNMYEGGLNAVMGTSSDELYQKQFKNIELNTGVRLTISGVKIKLVPSK